MGLSASAGSTTGRVGQADKVITTMHSIKQVADVICRKPLDAADQSKKHHANATRETEGAASRNSAPDPALRSIPSTSSWWSNISFWSKSESAGVETSSMGPRIEAMKSTKDRKEENT